MKKLTNVEVYRRLNAHTSILIVIVHKQLSFLGHVIGKDDLEGLVVTGCVDGKRARGRRRESFSSHTSAR